MIRYLMTRPGQKSLTSFLQTFPSSRVKMEKILVSMSPLFTFGALSIPYMMIHSVWGNSIHPHRACREIIYIELPRREYALFDDLSITFLNHFQLPICYDVGTKPLSTFRQDKATHILDHIQEWHRRKWLIKAFIPPKFILEWFLKLLLPYIEKDVSTSGF